MKTNTDFILPTVKVVFWIVFIGLCIKTGAILISFLVSLFGNPQGAQNLHLGLDLSELFSFSQTKYIYLMSLLIALSGLKAYMAYLVIRVFMKINPNSPFNLPASHLISQISEVALGTGILAIITNGYAKGFNKLPIDLKNLHPYLENGGEFLFLAGIIFVIAQIFKKGVEIQAESELTI